MTTERTAEQSTFDEIIDAWRLFADTIVWPDATTPLLQAEGLRYLTRYLSAGALMCLEVGDENYPQLVRFVDTTNSWAADNPDCVYLFTGFNGQHTYRITGHVGGARHLEFQVHEPNFMHSPGYEVTSRIDHDQLQTRPDGTVEIVLSPDSHDGNWLQTNHPHSSLLIRQYFDDWDVEPASLAIERVDAPFPPPPNGPASVGRPELLTEWLAKTGEYWAQNARGALSMPPNSVYFRPLEETDGGLRGLGYGLGNFHCQPDEAVIIEVTPPNCRYWSFALGNNFWETIDWFRRQSSLNNHQAQVDSDGVFRAVIAHHDPGVPNWLDCAGHTEGTLMARWLLADAHPTPQLRVVPLADVRDHLAPRTPTITADVRSEQLRQRYRVAMRRNRR